MSWFPDVHRPVATERDADAWQLVPYYRGLATLPLEVLLASWAVPPQIDDPRAGRVSGPDAFAGYVARTRDWLALADATTLPLATTSSASRSVEEVMLDPEAGGERRELGAAVVAEWDDEHRLTAVRIYHAGSVRVEGMPHLPQPPSPGDEGPPLPTFVREHHWAQAGGEVDDVLDTYEDDAVVVVFDRGVEVLAGREELRRLHSVPGVPGAPTGLQVCTVTDDGRTCAVEERLPAGVAGLPAQARVAVYERGPQGRILHERRYVMSVRPTLRSALPTATPEVARG